MEPKYSVRIFRNSLSTILLDIYFRCFNKTSFGIFFSNRLWLASRVFLKISNFTKNDCFLELYQIILVTKYRKYLCLSYGAELSTTILLYLQVFSSVPTWLYLRETPRCFSINSISKCFPSQKVGIFKLMTCFHLTSWEKPIQEGNYRAYIWIKKATQKMLQTLWEHSYKFSVQFPNRNLFFNFFET